ncbi:MAG: FtsX-like permease family protein [Phycisphaerae bacterium]
MIFPILVVWLCVMMMIIVTSIMGGFVERVQDSNRQLQGDVVIEARASLAGWPYYEELQRDLAKMPEVELTTPVIQAWGLINLPDQRYNNVAQIVGIDPAARAKISRFGQSLFWQNAAPKEAAEDLASALPATGDALQQAAYKSLAEARKKTNLLLDAPLPQALKGNQIALGMGAGFVCLVLAGLTFYGIWRPLARWQRIRLLLALILISVTGWSWWATWQGANLSKQKDLRQDQLEIANSRAVRAARTYEFSFQLPSEKKFQTRADLLAALLPPEPTFTPPPGVLDLFGTKANMPANGGCVVGIDVVPMYRRDRRGNYLHSSTPPYFKALLTVVPVTPRGSAIVDNADTRDFVIVDDSYTRFYELDKTAVYAPFAKVQEMARMQAGIDSNDRPTPARCNELQLRIKNSDDPGVLRDVTDRINEKIAQLVERHPDLMGLNVNAQTWEEKQIQYIRAVRNEKNMITFILGLMSLVVLVVIFLIFYMIVRDKTKDIGIIKALGGSEEGVAGIFMMYGLFIGAVGGLLGMISGVVFVWHTNEIHEWIFRTFGVMIWDRKVYMFDRIPDTVNWNEVLIYVGAAIVAGLVGALIPAIVAGSQNPVKAVRYE